MFWGCSGPHLKMPTPNVYLNAKQDAYSDLHEDLKRTEVRLFYITDRTLSKTMKASSDMAMVVHPHWLLVSPWWISVSAFPGKIFSRGRPFKHYVY